MKVKVSTWAIAVILLCIVIQFAFWTQRKLTRGRIEFPTETMATIFFVKDSNIFNITETVNFNSRINSYKIAPLFFFNMKMPPVFIGFFTVTDKRFNGIMRLRQGIFDWTVFRYVSLKDNFFYDCGRAAMVLNIKSGIENYIARFSLRPIFDFDPAENIGSFRSLESFSANISGISGFLGSLKPFVQVNSLKNQSPELKNSYESKDTSISYEPPILRRFLLVLFSLLFGLSLGFWGVYCLDNKRRLFGSALIGFGWLLFISGLYLWWVTPYSSTWDWLL